jgi:viroplasmin and RNaseH domain-containing protein
MEVATMGNIYKGFTGREDPEAAFDEAIASGLLSANRRAENWAGHYMYMCTQNGKDMFKHIETRRYILKEV